MAKTDFSWVICGLLLALALHAAAASAGGIRPAPELRRSPTGDFSPCPNAPSAKEAFERTWRAVRSSFGANGMPAPRLAFVGRRAQEMRVSGTAAGYRRVEVFGIERLALAGDRGCREALSARECLIHEFVHVFQAEPYGSGEIRPDQIYEEIPEGLAEARAQSLMVTVFGLRRSAYDEEVWSVYDAYARQIRKQYPASLIRRGQFGGNWGLNPRFVPWKEPNPVLARAGSRPRRP
jgi:hypothetical protein